MAENEQNSRQESPWLHPPKRPHGDDGRSPAAKGLAVMLDASDIGAILKCSPRTVYRLVDSGRMPPPVRLGSLIRWNRAVIDEWLAKGCPTCRRGREQ